MTEMNVMAVVGQALGERAGHLHDGVCQVIAQRVLVGAPARAVVVSIDGVRSAAWGARRNFSTLGEVEVYA